MRSATVLAPIGLPLIGAGFVTALGLIRNRVSRGAAGAGAWAMVAALGAVWIPLRSTQELAAGPLGFGSTLDVRIDATAFAFGLTIAVPAAVLITIQRRTWQESAISLLALAAAMAAIEAGGVVLTAIAGGTTATLALVLLEAEDPTARRPSWGALLAGWLALAWFGVLLQVRGGTAVFAAVPVSTVTPALLTLLAGSACLVSGLFPWRGWAVRIWSRPKLGAAGVIVATLHPLGFYLFVRAYELGGGRYPHAALNVAVAVLGVLVAFAAGLRAQAAPTRRQFFAEAVPAFGGLALMSIGIGTPLGLVSGLVLLATGAVLAACLALAPEGGEVASLLVIAACAGLPPGIAFGARVLSIESTFEAGDFLGLIGLTGFVAWVLWVVASARAVALPAAADPAGDTFPPAAAVTALATMAAGPALALVLYSFGDPVASEVMQATATVSAARFSDVVTTSTVLPAVALFGPLLLLAILVYPGLGAAALRPQPRPPLIGLGVPRWWTRARDLALAARIPDQYRSLVDFQELERAAAGGAPWLWIATLAALGFAVTR